MKKTFFKNLLRDIKKSLSRFLSIVVIIAVGVAFYAGVRATSPDMKKSGDLYFSKNNLMDFRLISTLGLTKDDVWEISKISGVTSAEGSYSLDAVTEREGRSQVLNINSLSAKGGINEIIIVKGRRPQNTSEAIVEDRYLKNDKLKIGDTITLKSGNETNLLDRLATSKFKIVGTAKSPLYISGQRQLSSVGNGSVRGFVYILPESFKSDVYTEIYVRTLNDNSQNSLENNEEYSNFMKPIETSLKSIGTARSEIRYAEVVKEGTESLNKGEKELERARKEAADKFADARRALENARTKILSGKEELRKNEILFNQGIAEGGRNIEEGRKQLLAAENEIESKAKEIEKGKLELAEGMKQLDEAGRKLNIGKQQAAEGISNAIAQRVEEAKKQSEENPLNPVYAYQYNALNQFYEKYIKGKDFDSMYAALKEDNKLDEIKPYFDLEALKAQEAQIDAGRAEFARNEEQLKAGEAQLNAGRQQLEAKNKELFSGAAKLNREREEGIIKLNKGRKELREGEMELNKNIVKLNEEEAKVNKKLEDAAAEIRKNREKLRDIKKPDWYVLGRGANIGYETYRQDSDRINNIGKAFPLIFFLVASLVSLTTMTRMVQDKRVEIGTFKAMGYSSGAIVAHYLIYALSASIIGSLIGISIGFRLFPPLIMNAYNSLYSIPYRVAPFNTGIALEASLVAILFVALAAIFSALDVLREVPASLMRPKPPKSGKRILLERFTFIWRRLSFTEKVTARNLFRYKQRLFMTVIGIAACTSLMITGYGIREGITGATREQFNRIYKFDLQGSLTRNVSEEEKNDIKYRAAMDANVKSVLFAYSKNASVKIGSSKSQDAYVIVPEDRNAIKDYITIAMNGKDISLDDSGVVLTEKLARMANKKVGDTIKITIDEKTIEARVSGITEHYIQHYIYMSSAYYERLMGEKISYNTFYGLLKNTSANYQEATSKTLKGIKDVNSIGFKNNIQIDYRESMKSVDSVVLVLIVSAGVLAFVVIYNLTNINITERRRELATIKLLGFYNSELAAYIYRENIILTIIGSIAGIFLGKVLNRYILLSAETNVIMFLNRIRPVYFLYSVLLTLLFSMVVNLAMYNRFDKIDMIDSLKSVE